MQPNTFSQPPTPPPSQPPIQPPLPNPQNPSTDPGKTLGIIGFILAFVANVIGLILSIVALNKSKKSGYKNNLALAGIIIGSISTLFWTIMTIIALPMALTLTSNILNGCSEAPENQGRISVNDKYYTCADSESLVDNLKVNKTSSPLNIAESEVTLGDSRVISECFSFTIPENYIMNPNSKSCQTELRMDNGSPSGVSLTSISVKYQTGSTTVDDFFTRYKKAGGDRVSNEQHLTINNREAGSLELVDGYGITQTVYIVTDNSGSYEYNGTPVTSFFISGPTNSKEPLATIIDSLIIN